MATAMAQAKSVRVSFSSMVSGQKMVGRGNMRFGKTDFAGDVTIEMASLGRARIIVLPKVLYLRLPGGAGLPAGKQWVKVKTNGRGNDPLTKALGPMMAEMQKSFDPERSLRLLAAVPTMTTAGTEQIDGVQTTKYTATIDMAKAAAEAKGPLAEQFRALVADGMTTMDYTIWVDGKDLPRKFRTISATAHGDLTMTYTYHDWGKPVTIEAPPASQVATTQMLVGT